MRRVCIRDLISKNKIVIFKKHKKHHLKHDQNLGAWKHDLIYFIEIIETQHMKTNKN